VRVLITGVCGFVGSTLARHFRERHESSSLEIVGLDNLSRAGSETNRRMLADLGVTVLHGDIRLATDVDACGKVDWVVDAAANPSVLAGVDGRTSSRQLIDNNLTGTINLLEHCKAFGAGFILLSTSRVYSIPPLAALPVREESGAFRPDLGTSIPGVSAAGISETFSTNPPVSLYGASKLASEMLALEYGHTFDLPVWINRCGVLAGAGQFGHAAQGIFSFWINAHLRRRPLMYIGFEGSGHQVRDCLHPSDVGAMVLKQMDVGAPGSRPNIVNLSGGAESSMSLRQLTEWCDDRFGVHAVAKDPRPRRFDVPWMVLDSTLAASTWHWRPCVSLPAILEEIASHAEVHPEWLQLSGAA
jgi:CDP-paratose 2-epimerase